MSDFAGTGTHAVALNNDMVLPATAASRKQASLPGTALGTTSRVVPAGT